MYVDLPKINRCCFCLPLRYGLIVWSYLKMIWCLTLIVMMAIRIASVSMHVAYTIDFIILGVIISSLIIDFIITLIFIIGAHKKNPKLLWVYYRYGIVTLVLLFLLYMFGIGMSVFEYFYRDMRYIYLFSLYETALFGAGVLILNLYVLALVRSEIIKLENNAQFSFQNHLTEPSCYMEQNESLNENNGVYKL